MVVYANRDTCLSAQSVQLAVYSTLLKVRQLILVLCLWLCSECLSGSVLNVCLEFQCRIQNQ